MTIPTTPDQRREARRTAVAIVRARLEDDHQREAELIASDPDPNNVARAVDEVVHLAAGAVKALAGGDQAKASDLLDQLGLRAMLDE